MDFEPGTKVRELQARLSAFMDAQVYPNEARYYAEQDASADRWQPSGLIEQLKPLAKAARLWNLFLPDSTRGAGLALRLADGPDEVHRNQIGRLELARH